MRCEYCGQEFELPAYWIQDVYSYDMTFCSHACRHEFRNIFPIPEEVEEK